MRLMPALVLSLVVLVGCDGVDENPPAASRHGPAELTVRMLEDSFQPRTITVRAGQTVTWHNESASDHTLTSGLGIGDQFGRSFDEEIAPGGTFAITFAVTGVHPYFCKWFEAQGMTAVVVVTR